MKKKNTLLSPRTVPHLLLEFSLHVCPRLFAESDVYTVFPSARDRSIPPSYELLCIATFQPANQSSGSEKTSLIEFSPAAAEFKDRCRNVFFQFMEDVEKKIFERMSENEKGERKSEEDQWWIDWPDPATGIPMRGISGPCVLTESEVAEQLFSFETVHVGNMGGGCGMIRHPKFGLDVYPASGFVRAPRDVVVEVLNELYL